MIELYQSSIDLLFFIDSIAGFNFWLQFSGATFIVFLLSRFVYKIFISRALYSSTSTRPSQSFIDDRYKERVKFHGL